MSAISAPGVAPQLGHWNEAREIAAELLTLFYHGEGHYSEVESAHPNVAFPPKPVVVQQLLDVNGRRRWEQCDDFARWVMTWEWQ